MSKTTVQTGQDGKNAPLHRCLLIIMTERMLKDEKKHKMSGMWRKRTVPAEEHKERQDSDQKCLSVPDLRNGLQVF